MIGYEDKGNWDGPAKTLIGYFNKMNYRASDNLKGVRKLTSK